MMEVKEVKYRMYVNRVDAQKIWGVLTPPLTVTLRNALAIPQQTEGKVYLDKIYNADEYQLNDVDGYYELRKRIEHYIFEKAKQNLTVEVNAEEIRKMYIEFEAEKEKKKKLEKQCEQFKGRDGYCLYYWQETFKKEMSEEERRTLEEIVLKIKNEILSEEEFDRNVKILDELYDNVQKRLKIKELQENIEKIETKYEKLREKYDMLISFINDEVGIEKLKEYFIKKHEEVIKEEVIRKSEEMFAEEEDDDC